MEEDPDIKKYLDMKIEDNVKDIKENALRNKQLLRNFLEGLKDEAKQMAKGQRIKDYNAGYTDGQCNHINDADNYANEQEYLTT